MRVRKAIWADGAGIARVHVDSWRTAYRGIVPQDYLDGLSCAERQTQWERGLCAPNAEPCTYVGEDESGQIVGFANGGRERSGDPVYRGEIYAIYILQPHQRKGLGRELVRKVVEALQGMGFNSMLVWVLADNPSRRFYEALGGVVVRTQAISIGGMPLEEVAYGWKDLRLTWGPGGEITNDDR